MKIIFIHIPRTAGTTIGTQIAEQVSDGAICPAWDNSTLQKIIADGSVDNYTVFSGHFHYNTTLLIPGEKFVFTFLRSPISRFISEILYVKNHYDVSINSDNSSNVALYDFYNRCNIEDIVENAVENKITNRMCRHFVNDWNDCSDFSSFETVKNRIRTLDFVGTTESLSSDLDELSFKLGIKLRCKIMNVSEKRPLFMNSEVIKKVMKLFYYDILLYKEFERHFES